MGKEWQAFTERYPTLGCKGRKAGERRGFGGNTSLPDPGTWRGPPEHLVERVGVGLLPRGTAMQAETPAPGHAQPACGFSAGGREESAAVLRTDPGPSS